MSNCCKANVNRPDGEEFSELLKYTGAGYAGGLLTGFTLDSFGFSAKSVGSVVGPQFVRGR